MKICIVNNSDKHGGAARAAQRLHQALVKNGINSVFLVQHLSTVDSDVRIVGPRTVIGKLWAKVRSRVERMVLIRYALNIKTPFSTASLPAPLLVKKINSMKPDIVHLHWVNAGMIAIEDLEKIEAPIVWSMHDDWVYTGGCHVKWGCNKFMNACGACPQLLSNIENDSSRQLWTRKKQVFDKLNSLTFIGLSRWSVACAKVSSLLQEKEIVHIPNLIDITMFKKLNTVSARQKWNISPESHVIILGSMGTTEDPNKGYSYAMHALSQLSSLENVCIIVFGTSEKKNRIQIDIPITYVGHIDNDQELISLYSAADVIMVPSLQENLSNTIMEAMACELPVVAFDVGGNRDFIQHKHNGYLAKPFNTSDLAQGVCWLIRMKQKHVGQVARETIIETFEEQKVALQYKKLYTSLSGTI